LTDKPTTSALLFSLEDFGNEADLLYAMENHAFRRTADMLRFASAQVAALREERDRLGDALSAESGALDLSRREVQRLTEALQTAREKAFGEAMAIVKAHQLGCEDEEVLAKLAALRTAGEGK